MLIEKTIDRESQQKLYVQVYSIIKGKIESGEWPASTQIPTEDELCKTYNVSKATVRIGISELVKNGYLRKQQGKGTFVTFSMHRLGLAMRTRLTEDMFGEGVKAKKDIVAKGVKEPTDEIKAYLKRSDGIYAIICKRVVDGEPAYLEESFVPLDVFPGIDNEDVCQQQFYDLIQEKAVKKISKVVQIIEVSEMSGEAAAMLKVFTGAPALLLHRLLIGSDGNPIAYTRLMGIGRKYKIQTEFERIR